MNQKSKEDLRNLAVSAKKEMNRNKDLRNKITEIKENIDQYKILFNIKNLEESLNGKNFKTELLSELKSFIRNLQSKNAKIKNEIKKMNDSVKDLNSQFYSKNSYIVNELEREKENSFILSNKIIEKENVIKHITIALNRIRRCPLFQEAKRDIRIESKAENEACIKDCLASYQEALLKQCKKYNKVSNKIQKRQKTKKLLKNEIKSLKPSTSRKKERIKMSILTTEGFAPKVSRKRKSLFSNFMKKEEFLIYDSDNESDFIIDEDLHSDEEINFIQRIKPKRKLSQIENKGLVPKLDLKQISYNKKKIVKEIDLYSLERRCNDEDTVRSQILEKKSKIKKMNKKIKMNKKKLEKFEDCLKKCKSKYKMIRYLSTNSTFVMTTEENEKINDEPNDRFEAENKTHSRINTIVATKQKRISLQTFETIPEDLKSA